MSRETKREHLPPPEKLEVINRFEQILNRVQKLPHLSNPTFEGVIIERARFFAKKSSLYPVMSVKNPFKSPKSQFSYIHHDYLQSGIVNEIEEIPEVAVSYLRKPNINYAIPDSILFTINSQANPILVQNNPVDYVVFWKGLIKPGIGDACQYPGMIISPEKPPIENILLTRQAVKLRDPERYTLEESMALLGLFRNPTQTLSALNHFKVM